MRFGIPAPEPREIWDAGTLLKILTNSVGKGVIKVTNVGRRRELRLETDVYAPSGLDLQGEDEQYLKVRLATPFFDLVIRPFALPACEWHYQLPQVAQIVLLKDLWKIAELILFMEQAAKQGESIQFEASVNSLPILWGQIATDAFIDDELLQTASIISHAWATAKYFDVQQDVKVNLRQLFRQREQLASASFALSSTRGLLRFEFTSSENVPPNDKDWCLPFVSHVMLDQYRMIMAAAVLGRVDPTQEMTEHSTRRAAEVTAVQIHSKYLYDRHETVGLTPEELLNLIIEEHPDTYHLLFTKM